MNIKETFKKNKSLVRAINFARDKRHLATDFSYDKRTFSRNYEKIKARSANNVSYDLIRVTHSLEKGLSHDELRPFGNSVIAKLTSLLEEYESLNAEKNFAYNLAISALDEYLALYEKQGWTTETNYKRVKAFLKGRKITEDVESGIITYSLEDLERGKVFDYEGFLKTRHSVRKFSTKKVKNEDLEKAITMALCSPSACNRQMIKAYSFSNKKDIDYISSIAQGVGGFVLDGINYFIITFDLNSFYFSGERNQGWFNAGLFSMNLANALHSLGIGSCFIQFGNSPKEEELAKKRLNIPDNERIAVLVAYGYYKDKTKAPRSPRKDIDEVLKCQ